jgi:D-sedoheptulose 7-phosphate isomerase
MPDSPDPAATVQSIFGATIEAHERFSRHGVPTVIAAARAITQAVTSGGKVLAFGNGGSASDAAHFVAELVGRFESERQALAAITLGADTAVLTAIGNDFGYERVFAQQIDALGRPGDIALGISTSGRSPNVEAAMAAAKARQMFTIALTGRDGGSVAAHADIHLNVAELSTARVQEVHRTIMHALCALIDGAVRATK